MLKLERICASYGKTAVLQDLTACLPEGEVSAVTGLSGVGKTTLLNILAGLLKPSSGLVSHSYQRPAYIFQDPRLFPWMTALENVSMICGDEKKAAMWLDRLLGDPEAKAKYPDELSGGMKQRVSIARALAYEGDAYFLDEPFKGLDEVTKRETACLFFEAVKGKTVLMVTHDKDDLAYCQSVFRLEGTPASRLVLEKSSTSSAE